MSKGITWTRDAEGSYVAKLDGKPIPWRATRNDNEPAHSPIAWVLREEGVEYPPAAESYARKVLTMRLAEILKRRTQVRGSR